MEERTERTMEEKPGKQELKDEKADLVAGGAGFSLARCPSCGSTFCTIRNGRRICSECGREY